MALDFQLAIDMPPGGARDRGRRLHDQLRAAILDGRLRAGLALPASRSLAKSLGVSRNLVVAAYEMLTSEGYVTTRPGGGTFVADVVRSADRRNAVTGNRRPRLRDAARDIKGSLGGTPKDVAFDFRLGVPDQALLPFDAWRRLSSQAIRSLSREPAQYHAPEGFFALRDAIARHVSLTRAVACQPGDIVVTNGAQQAFDLLARILVRPGETIVAVEDPGYPPLRDVFLAAGAIVRFVAVDEEGIVVDQLPPDVDIICVTPSHQFPLGVAMSPARRIALLTLARERGVVILEDDYDSEFRFGGRPLDALQTLDRTGSVVYIGTFSKSLFPALRLGFAVLPEWIMAAFIDARRRADWHTPALAQATLTRFIDEGHLARHVRRMRKVYGARRNALMAALTVHCAESLQIIPADAGLHIAAWLSPGLDADQLASRLLNLGVAVETLGRYSVERPRISGFAFGYGAIETGRIGDAIGALASAIG